ncbi:Mor family transcriptional regulator [Salirhabdus euzebyi]|uniref:Mor family transcriptional regulator n=1 Tax=Salirhabdus euzebyi TaxID=394506 RepID=A0A841Q2K3_9BACI|nr:CD3324 family protein [Salirhabdus euzebyi]MBB6452715.1 Mor family transcriptional regulator [Salirhabdus euzebyi]
MKYVKANTVLPQSLLSEIQKYIQGETIYIPKVASNYRKWGTKSGGRKRLDDRNHSIKHAFQQGVTLEELASSHYLSIESVKKIVYSK